MGRESTVQSLKFKVSEKRRREKDLTQRAQRRSAEGAETIVAHS
jgi:hypothetical protein